MKKMEKESNKIKLLSQNDKNNGPQAHKIISGFKKSKWAKEVPKNESGKSMGIVRSKKWKKKKAKRGQRSPKKEISK